MYSKPFPFLVRQARLDDVPTLNNLITASMWKLGVQHYTRKQIESALLHVVGVDTQVIQDGTYYVVETHDGTIAGCGGWSCRGNLAGADHSSIQLSIASGQLAHAASIRAFFVHPDWARMGVATRLLRTCEMIAYRAGFYRLELLATLVGFPVYLKSGFLPVENVLLPLPDDEIFPAVKMVKDLSRTYPMGR